MLGDVVSETSITAAIISVAAREGVEVLVVVGEEEVVMGATAQTNKCLNRIFSSTKVCSQITLRMA